MMKTIKTYLHDYKVLCYELKAVREKHRKGVVAANVLAYVFSLYMVLVYYVTCKFIDWKDTYIPKETKTEEES